MPWPPDPAEATATLAIRAGDPTGLDFYTHHDRIHTPTASREDSCPVSAATLDGGVTAECDVLDAALEAWAADRTAGSDSLLLAGSNTVVTELNARARATRLAEPRGGERTQSEVRLRDGTAASVGDLVLARRNDRTLAITGTDWVKNGDRFTVLGLTGDGGLLVRHAPTRRALTLPAGYVAEHLQLGYAATIHLAQGATVDTTHTVLTGTESRQQLYVALSRGRHANHLHLHLVTGTDADLAHPALNPARRPGDQGDPLEVLQAVLARTDDRPSATSTLTDATHPGRQLHTAVDRYLDAHTLAAATTTHAGEEVLTGGPLPWLPPPPDPDPAAPDRGELAEYLQQRADLVHALAASITADQLPATEWANQLRQTDPDLAQRLAVWRAATGVPDHPDPLGPPSSPTPNTPAQLRDQLLPHLAAHLPDHDRWHVPVVDLEPRQVADPDWASNAQDEAPGSAIAPTQRIAGTHPRTPRGRSHTSGSGAELLRTSTRDHERAVAANRPKTRGIAR